MMGAELQMATQNPGHKDTFRTNVNDPRLLLGEWRYAG